MNFYERRIGLNQQIEELKTEQARTEQELEFVKLALHKIGSGIISAQQELDTAALKEITEQSNQDAWEYLRARTNYTDESWAIIKERLPKLLKILDDEDEIYLQIRSFIESEWGSEINQASLTTSLEISINIDSRGFVVNNFPITNSTLQIILGEPLKTASYKKPFIDIEGALIGSNEVELFINTFQNDPMRNMLMFRIALELCSNEHTIVYWHKLSNDIRSNILHECIRYVLDDPTYLAEGGFFDGWEMVNYKNALFLEKCFNIINADTKPLEELLLRFPDLANILKNKDELPIRINRAKTFVIHNRYPPLEGPYEH